MIIRRDLPENYEEESINFREFRRLLCSDPGLDYDFPSEYDFSNITVMDWGEAVQGFGDLGDLPRSFISFNGYGSVDGEAEIWEEDAVPLLEGLLEVNDQPLGLDNLEASDLALENQLDVERLYTAGVIGPSDDYKALIKLDETGLYGLRTEPTYFTPDAEFALAHASYGDEMFLLQIDAEGIIENQDVFLDPESAAYVHEQGRAFLTYGGIPGQFVEEINYFEHC